MGFIWRALIGRNYIWIKYELLSLVGTKFFLKLGDEWLNWKARKSKFTYDAGTWIRTSHDISDAKEKKSYCGLKRLYCT